MNPNQIDAEFAWALMQFIFSPIRAWSDRFGRRPVILIPCFGLGLDYIFMALAPSLGWLLIGRIISGITASNISSAFAYVTDVTPPEKRAKQFGYLASLRPGLHRRPSRGRISWQHQSPFSLLGRRLPQPSECHVRFLRPS